MWTKSRPFVHPGFRPALDQLEERDLLAVTVGFDLTTGILNIKGTNNAEVVRLTDNGNGNIAVKVTGSAVQTFAGVKQVDLLMRDGNDQVTYNLSGNQNLPLALTARLGAGVDRFTANLGSRDLFSILTLRVLGQAGNEVMSFNQAGEVHAIAKLQVSAIGGAGDDVARATLDRHILGPAEFNFNGGAGRDRFTFTATNDIDVLAGFGTGSLSVTANDDMTLSYRGEVGGRLTVNLTGTPDEDRIFTTLTIDPNSGIPGFGTVTASVRGGADDDRLTLLITNNSGGTTGVTATIAGDAGRDICTFTGGVVIPDASCEVMIIK